MPTVLKVGPYRFFFYSSDGGEPPHVHVERDDHVAKFWIDPVRLDVSGGYRRPELREIERIVRENARTLLEAWHGFFAG
jgi:hypothetical protein